MGNTYFLECMWYLDGPQYSSGNFEDTSSWDNTDKDNPGRDSNQGPSEKQAGATQYCYVIIPMPQPI